MNIVNLYSCGRKIVQGAWYCDKIRILNRLYYVNSGCATICNSSYEYTLTKGNAYIIPQCNNFHPITSKDFDHTYFDYYSSQILNPDKIIVFNEKDEFVRHYFNFINTIIDNDNINTQHRALESLLSGFLLFAESNTDRFQYISNTLISKAIKIIHSNYACINTKILAEELNLNESYFIRLFKKTIGIAPMKYIRACRVLYGKELLLSGLSIDEASEKCGYSSPPAFYKAVRTELGAKPSDLKK